LQPRLQELEEAKEIGKRCADHIRTKAAQWIAKQSEGDCPGCGGRIEAPDHKGNNGISKCPDRKEINAVAWGVENAMSNNDPSTAGNFIKEKFPKPLCTQLIASLRILPLRYALQRDQMEQAQKAKADSHMKRLNSRKRERIESLKPESLRVAATSVGGEIKREIKVHPSDPFTGVDRLTNPKPSKPGQGAENAQGSLKIKERTSEKTRVQYTKKRGTTSRKRHRDKNGKYTMENLSSSHTSRQPYHRNWLTVSEQNSSLSTLCFYLWGSEKQYTLAIQGRHILTRAVRGWGSSGLHMSKISEIS